MSIAICAPIVEPRPTGVGVYSINLINEMSRLGDGLALYTSYPEAFNLGAAQVRGIHPCTRPQRGRRGFINRILWMQSRLPLRTLRNGDSVLFSTGSEGSLLPLVPQVVTVHDLIPILFPELHPHPVEVFFFRYMLPQILRRCAAVIAVSESTKRDVIRLYGTPPHKIHVIYEGFDENLFRPCRDTAGVRQALGLDRYIHYAGNIIPHKNVARLVEAFSLIADRVPHRLVLQGRRGADYAAYLERLIAERGLEGRVLFPGYIPIEQLPQLYSGASAFVTVSLSEGFGLPPLEAMACGTPVIASNTSSLPEVVGDAGILVDPGSPQQIADAMLRVIEDEAHRDELSRRAVEQASRFSWRRAAEQTLGVLRSEARG